MSGESSKPTATTGSDMTRIPMAQVRNFPGFAILFCVLGVTIAAEAAQRPFVSMGSSWRYVLGTREASVPSDAWRRIAFDDSNWSLGPTPIGYGVVAEVGRIVTTLPKSN